MKEKTYQTLSVAVPKTLLKKLDDLVGTGIYVSRSDAVRVILRKFLEGGS